MKWQHEMELKLEHIIHYLLIFITLNTNIKPLLSSNA